MHFSEYSSPLEEYRPIPRSSAGEKASVGCQTSGTKSDRSTSTQDHNNVSVYVQCEPAKKTYSEQGLQEFISRIYPSIHRELSKPTPQLFQLSLREDEVNFEFQLEKSLSSVDMEMDGNQTIVSTWMSVNPMLVAISCSPKIHKSFCDHSFAQVHIISGSSSTTVTKIPIRACASVVYADECVKDILAIGTVLGDLYVFKLKRQSGGTFSFDELLCSPGHHGCVSTIKWFKSGHRDQQEVLICGHDNGITTWIYEPRHERMKPGKLFTTEHSVLEAVRLIEPISETSFCLSRRGVVPAIYDITNYTTRDKKNTLIAIAECREIDPLLEVSSMKFFENSLLITTKQNDIYEVKLIDGRPEAAVCLYRLSQLVNVRDSLLVLGGPLKNIYALCLKSNNDLELILINSGKTKTLAGSEIIHISVAKNLILGIASDGTLGIFSVVDEGQDPSSTVY